MPNRRLRLVPVAVAVIERRGRCLISRRRASDHLGGCWEFPGGKRRVGELWEACLKRELREELGITVEPTGRLSPIRFRYTDRQVYLEVFRCRITAGVPTPLGCQEVRWVKAVRLRRYRFPPADRELIASLSKRRRGIIRVSEQRIRRET